MSTSNKRPAKKTTLSDREYVAQAPAEDDIAALVDKEGNLIARYLPIEVIERDLDRWSWSTENFTYQQYRSLDKYGRPCISASLELVILWKSDTGVISLRRIVGACNFVIGQYAPNEHFVATAKSECVKNAASDLGRKFGRGLNEGRFPETNNTAPAEQPKGKMKPDKGILEQFKKAVEEGDETHKGILLSIYEFIPEDNGNETI